MEISLLQLAPPTWTRTTLGEIVERGGGSIQTGPFGSQLHASDYVPEGIPSIMPVNIGENRLIRDGIACISESDAQRLSKHIVRKGDIIYSRRGDVERRALVRESEEGWFCGTGCLKVRLGHGVIVPEFAAFYLGHPEVRLWIVRHAVGITMPNLNTSIMESVPFLLPPLYEQQAIAETLQSLDDKIEQNRRTGVKLEGLARAVFKAWFVDFEPVKAKAAGATAFPGMPPETFAALPKTLQDFPLGPVPEGWEVKAATEVATVAIGKTPPRKEPQWFSTDPSDVRWVSISDMGSCGVFIRDTSEYLTAAGVERFNVRRIPDRSVLFSFKLTVGRVAIVDGETTSNEAIAHFVPAAPDAVGTEFLYCYLSSFDHAQLGSTSSIATATNSKAVKAMPVLVPDAATATSFTSSVRPLFELIRSLSRESAKLATLRDYLLPRLLSGRVRVGVTND